MTTQLGRYRLDKKIGAGGMADVWLAHGPNGVCVLKCPHKHLCDNAEFVRMFLDEASILAQLHHPGIAQIYDLGQADGTYYLAMEYVPGFDLMSISLEHERHGELMSPELCARIVADAAAALHYAHEAKDKNGRPLNIVHRDVTPHNILLSTQGVVKLIDFGVAKASSTMHRTQAGFVKGKYPYMSPEQITGQVIDRRVDVYALGLVLYELLTNVRAIPGNTEIEQIDAARAGRIRPIEQLRPNVPVPLRQILGGCLHHDVEGRYPTALAVKEDLEKYLTLERQVLGQDDLLRLFRVVAADVGDVSLAGRPTEQEQPVSAGGVVVVPDTPLSPGQVDALGYSSTVPSMKSLEAKAPIPLATPVGNAGPVPVPPEHDPRTTEPATLAPPVSRTPLFVLTGLSVLIIGLVLALWQPWATPAETLDRPVAVVIDAGSDIPGKLEAFTFPVEDAGAQAEDVDAGAEVVAAAEPDAGEPVPSAGMASVRVTADAAAFVTVDGRKVGPAPQELELPPGVHLLAVKGPTIDKKVKWNLKAGDSRTFAATSAATSAPPTPTAKGEVRIDASPFCVMKVDGKPITDGPVSFKAVEVTVGLHTVECALEDPSLPAPRVKKQKVTVLEGQASAVKFNMLVE